MEAILLEILNLLKTTNIVDQKQLAHLMRQHNKTLEPGARPYSKKRLMGFYFKTKETNLNRWLNWDIDIPTEKRLLQTLQMKPRRTASGVATITVITKPWVCSSNCIYCPNDLRMPKSYLSAEPACQRAERNYFDPYLQVVSRLRALTQMGHVADKIELIILGGTWSDYPETYQTWFMCELFRALNHSDEEREITSKQQRDFYKHQGLDSREEVLAAFVQQAQQQVNEGSLTYNQAVRQLYGNTAAWIAVSAAQTSTFDQLEQQHTLNETAEHRMVGLVVETRPDTITSESLTLLRRFGCTKVQIGIQSLDPAILHANNRNMDVQKIREAFDLLRIFGFKIHTHFMVNLHGATPEDDKRDYARFVTEKSYLPDEVKLYPCSLVNGTKLCDHYAAGTWRPYTEEELLDILSTDTLITPPYTRISRMIRDISAQDIVVGNKKSNLRQLVENRIEQAGSAIAEIRYREISTSETDVGNLTLEVLTYETTATQEHFLQWTTPENKIAGFLRLSLPHESYLREYAVELPVAAGEAMIREVHVYGKVAKLHGGDGSAQHLGLGKRLIAEACAIARESGYAKINVISSVGTREYYRAQGFRDHGLYQQRETHFTPQL